MAAYSWPEHRLKPCGTLAAYRRHQRRGEKPCYDCRAANRMKTTRDGYPAGRAASAATPADHREIRNGLPAFVPYIYRGLGYDAFDGTCSFGEAS